MARRWVQWLETSQSEDTLDLWDRWSLTLGGRITWENKTRVGSQTSNAVLDMSIGNVGPGLAAVGPTENYLFVPWPGKLLLSGIMIIGRLEILPILILFNPEVWRR